MIRKMGVIILLRSGLGLDNSLGVVQAHVSSLALFQLACSCSWTEVMCTYTHTHLRLKQQQQQ